MQTKRCLVLSKSPREAQMICSLPPPASANTGSGWNLKEKTGEGKDGQRDERKGAEKPNNYP